MKRRDWLVVGALVLLGFLHVAPALLTGRVYARNDFGSEVVPAFALLHGRFPFFGAPSWNPAIFGGTPAEVLPVMSRYPLNLFAYLLPPERSVPLFIGIHLALAAVAAWLFLRRVVETSTPAAAFGAMVYAFGGALWLRGMHVQNLAVAAWAPLLLLGVWEICAAGTPEARRRWTAILAGCGAMTLLVGGGLQILYLVALAGLVMIADGLGHRTADGARRSRAIIDSVPWLAAAIGLAILAGLPALLPYYETLANGARGELSLAHSGSFSLSPPSFVRLVAPDLLVGHDQWTWPAYVERWFYFGVLTLPLAAFGARDPRGKSILLLAIAGTVLALGLYGPLHYLLWFLLPGYDHLRAHGRWVVLVGLAVGSLAARGLDQVLEDSDARRPAAIGAVVLSAVAVLALVVRATGKGPFEEPLARNAMLLLSVQAFLAGGWLLALFQVAGSTALPRTLAAFAACALLAADAGSIALRMPLAEPKGALAAPSVVQEASARAQGRVRIAHDESAGPRALNNGARWGYRNARGYSQAIPYRYSRLLDLGQPARGARFTGLPERLDPRLLRLLGVGLWIGDDDARPPAGFSRRPVALASGLAAWEADEPPFEAALVGTALVVRGEDAARAASLAIDPRAVAVVERDVGLPAPGTLDGPGAGKIHVERRKGNEILLRTESDREALAVVGESWHPRWRATVDGTPAEVLPADAVWMAVQVPAGSHEVRLVARSGTPWWAWPSMLAAIGMMVTLGRSARRGAKAA